MAEDLVIFGSRDGHVYALDENSGRRRWSAETSGQVWSSPAIAGGRVYIGSADGYVYCVSLHDGSGQWRFATTGASLESSQFGYDRRTVESSPAVVNGVVYVGGRDGFLYAINADSGTLRWRFDHKASWVVTSPAVGNGVVYAGSSDNAFVQALDAETGAELWRTRTGGIVWSSPALSGQTIYVGDGIGRLHALDARTGAERWLFRTGESVHSSPVVSDSLVIFGSADRGVYALRTTDGPTTARAIFFDSTLSKATSTDDAALIMRYFRNRGYAVLDQAGIDAFLDAHATGGSRSVVVFATDVVRHPANLRRYLDGGGTVVWPGNPPGIWPRDSATGARRGYGSIDWDAPRRITNVDHSNSSFDEHSARPTAAGISFGLTPYRAAWGVDPRSVTTVLALDDWGNATSWVKQLGDKPRTGFIRVPSANLLAMYLLAEKDGGFTTTSNSR
jgi:outer membrane protein assembly factor BamB